MTPSKGQVGNESSRASAKTHSCPLISKASSRAGSTTPSIKGNEGQDDGRDDVSVAESSKGNRKTEEERIQFFHSQPDCREVEPHRAFCIGCDQWVPLNSVRPYVMRPWVLHRRECRRNSLTTEQYDLDSSSLRLLSHVPPRRDITKTPSKEGLDESKGGDDVTSVVQSSSEKLGRLKGEAERQAYLEGDPRAEEVRPYEVLCKTCKKWVQLGNKTRFSLGHWKDHQKRCSGSMCVSFCGCSIHSLMIYIALAAASPRRSGNSSSLMTRLQSLFRPRVCGADIVMRP
jgi:hypothetical protein